MHIRFIIILLLENNPDCSPAGAHFFGEFLHAIAGVFLDDLCNVSDELRRLGGVRVLLISLAF